MPPEYFILFAGKGVGIRVRRLHLHSEHKPHEREADATAATYSNAIITVVTTASLRAVTRDSDVLKMEQSQQRTFVLAALKERVAKIATHRLDDRQVLQMAIACSMREPADVLGMLFPPRVAHAAKENASKTGITVHEWNTIFGNDSHPLQDIGPHAAVQSQEFRDSLAAIGIALRCTTAETQQKQRWQRSWNQALCYIATHLNDPDPAIEAAIGTVVRSDTRRLEELYSLIDDNGCNTMLVTRIIIAISECIV